MGDGRGLRGCDCGHRGVSGCDWSPLARFVCLRVFEFQKTKKFLVRTKEKVNRDDLTRPMKRLVMSIYTIKSERWSLDPATSL